MCSIILYVVNNSPWKWFHARRFSLKQGFSLIPLLIKWSYIISVSRKTLKIKLFHLCFANFNPQFFQCVFRVHGMHSLSGRKSVKVGVSSPGQLFFSLSMATHLFGRLGIYCTQINVWPDLKKMRNILSSFICQYLNFHLEMTI